jgi:hypothetical protein
MKNTKKMSPEFFANYLTLDVFPNLEEDYVIDTIILQKTKFQFATECPECHNYMLRGIKYDMPNFLKNVDIYSYFDTLFEDLDVVWKKTLYNVIVQKAMLLIQKPHYHIGVMKMTRMMMKVNMINIMKMMIMVMEDVQSMIFITK